MFKIIQLDVSNNYLYIKTNSNNYEVYNWDDFKNNPILQKQNFERTLASIGSKASGLSSLMTSQSDMAKSFGSTNILDLEKRSSWTHKLKFILNLPNKATQFFKQNNILCDDDCVSESGKFLSNLPSEAREFFEQNNILCEKDCIDYDYFSLLKYETGDFFLNHRDTDLTDVLDNSVHQYTCLIFCPYGCDNEILQGGELILKHPDKLYEIKFDPSVETNKNRFVMVIFSIDMYHEVLPVISGSRYVFKKPLFVKTTTKKIKDINETRFDDLCDGGGLDFSGRGGDY